MGNSFPQTSQMVGWLARMREGDRSAREELVRHVRGRLERLTRKMLSDYPPVKSLEQTDDVLNNALLRLLHALEQVDPKSTREFLGLASLQIRRELLDLAKHYYGPEGPGKVKVGLPPDQIGAVAPQAADPVEVAVWREFHENIQRLPENEREVFGLIYYQDLTQAEAAIALNVSVRTVQRRWQDSLLSLRNLLGGDFPEL